jgi:hypothetical protein
MPEQDSCATTPEFALNYADPDVSAQADCCRTKRQMGETEGLLEDYLAQERKTQAPHLSGRFIANQSSNTGTMGEGQSEDLLMHDGKDCRRERLLDRKLEQRRLLNGCESDARIHYVDYVDGEGMPLFDQVCKHDLEGIVAKQKTHTLRDRPRGQHMVQDSDPRYSQWQDGRNCLSANGAESQWQDGIRVPSHVQNLTERRAYVYQPLRSAIPGSLY